jgi:ABC-2 type transport system permease protein
MTNAIRLYFQYIGISIRAQMQYRASFVMLSVGHFLATGIEIVGIWALFERFESLRGWSLAEVGLFYGLIQVAFAVAEALGRGFDAFPAMVRSGDFDRLLLRPRSAAFQVAAREVQLTNIGRLAQGLIVLLVAASALNVHWSFARVVLAVSAILGGACLFYGLFVLQATLSFWTTETLEIINTVTYGGTETGQFPLSIYRSWFRKFFTFIIPLACVSYFPALAILGRDDPALGSPIWFRWLAPLIGVMFLLASLQAWRFGVRHYRSTGS